VRFAPERPTLDPSAPVPTPPTVAELVRDVAGHGGRLTGAELAQLVRRVAAVSELWQPLARHDAEHRWWARLHWSPTVEVWLLGWETGQATDLHDHGGSSGAFTVTDGELVELQGSVERWRGGRWRSFAPGRATGFGPAYVHDLHRPAAGPATSIHAYSPPLRTMTFYRPAGTRLVPWRTEWTDGPEPAAGTAGGAGAGDGDPGPDDEPTVAIA
jgi:hypothetical protein